ncbi:MAG: M16 family metallopeptidase [Acidobacteriota bacterium]
MAEDRNIQTPVFETRLTLVTEEISSVRSTSLGIWIKMGSRYEAPSQAGISHFIEHMLFQGTERRTSQEIAIAIDAMGGQLDAFTTKESACYYANVLDEHLDDALELLSDIVLQPRFDAEEMEQERSVILEELASVEDVPEDYLYEQFVQTFWFDHPLGTPILGHRETIERLEDEDLREYFGRAYDPANVVVAAAGRLDHDAVAARVRGSFGSLETHSELTDVSPPHPNQHFRIIEREELEQVHIGIGTLGTSATDEDRYIANVLNSLLGGSLSSRLFQRIREQHGLAYNVYSSLGSYSDAGYLWIYAATRPEAAATVIELILEELTILREVPVTAEELGRMKEHLKGSIMLGLESTAGRMSSLAQQEIYFDRAFDLDEILAGINAVTTEQLQQLAEELFDDTVISLDILAHRPAARKLESRFADGVSMPGGGCLTPSR